MRRKRLTSLLGVTLTMLLTSAPALMQQGDRRGEPQPEVWRNFKVPPSPPRKPEEALKSFRVAPGFRVELVAAEPLVVDPVALTWDADGRMWVVEMRGWMLDVNGKGEDKPSGQVAVLEDTNGDGRMDKRTTFLDGLVMPRAVAMVDGGVLIAEPPNLWFCRDANGDLRCDRKARVDTYAHPVNVEHTDNGLMWALDNWMYNAKSARRFKFRKGRLSEDETALRGQWGITQDDYGRLYTNTNSSYLHGDFFPYEYLARNPHLSRPLGIYADLVGGENQDVHSIRVNPGINRGYRSSSLRPDGRLYQTTCTCGPGIYRGDQFPDEYHGNAFIPEPAGNVVACFAVQEEGVELKGRHKLYPDADWGQREFLASTDERFRPVNAYTGPDGGLYIVDLYRGVLEHRIYMTSYLRKYILEHGLDKPVGLGRIYRVVSASKKPGTTRPLLSSASSAELVRHLSHANGWWRDTAQRLLVERADRTSIPELRTLAASGASHLGRIHALWTLHGMSALDAGSALAGLSHTHPQVRIAALRTCSALFSGKERSAIISKLVGMTSERDQSVRIQLMFTLGECDGDELAQSAMSALLEDQASDVYLRQAALSGLAARELVFLERLLEGKAWQTEKAGYREIFKELAAILLRGGEAGAVEQLFSRIAAQPEAAAWRQTAMLEGVLSLSGQESYVPVRLRQKPEALFALIKSSNQNLARLAQAAERAVTWPGDERSFMNKPAATPLTPRQLQQSQQGREIYAAYCASCHLPNGNGQEGLAPPLVNAPKVLGSPPELIRIILDGQSSPKWSSPMPGFRNNRQFNDEGVAALLTFLRREWGHTASPVEAAMVKQAGGR
ncbi:MAG: c-type cytochrome [Acidobacteria bacterium]|nr:c-type cytochrome [Acidobacteriota bacterium]